MEDKYQEAVALFEAGNLLSAENLLQDIITRDSTDYDVLNFLGIIYLNLGNYDKSADYFEQVLELRSDHALSMYNLALCRQRMHEYEKARSIYKKLLELTPVNTEALNNIGVCCYKLGDYAEAEKYYGKALKLEPVNPLTFTNLGNLNLATGSFDDSIRFYKKAIEAAPGNDIYHFNLGSCYLQQNNNEEALKCFRKAVELNPANTGAYNNMGIVYSRLGTYQEAEKIYKKVLELNPDNSGPYFNLAYSSQLEDDLETALRLYRKVLELDPENKGAYVNIGNILGKMGRKEEADAYFDKVAEGKEEKAIAFTNLGLAKFEQGFPDEAIQYIDIALRARPDLPEVHYNKAHVLLLYEKFEEGWKQYEWRKKRKEFTALKCSKPELKRGSEDINGKKILVYDEQGLGDSIHFLRYLTMLKEKGAFVIFVCDPRIAVLLRDFKDIDLLIEKKEINQSETDFDYYVPLLSLPFYFNTNLDSIPARVPYLFPDTKLYEKWKRFFDKSNKFKIGIVWAGNPNHTGDRHRSCSINEFKKVFSLPGTEFFSLQKGDALKQLEGTDLPLHVLDEFIKSFEDTAAIIANLDLVISVDTSVAHLAGALGKPVWTLLPKLPDWRWLLVREDSPWYPTMRLFRQTETGNWAGVFHRVYKELELTVSQKNFGDALSNTPLTESSANTAVTAPVPAVSPVNQIPENRNMNNENIYLGFPPIQENYGWGVVCNNLKAGMSKFTSYGSLGESPDLQNKMNLKGTLFQLLKDLDFNPLYEARADKNIGYTVFESELTDQAAENAKHYDKVVAASSWCAEKIRFKGISNTDLLIQGIDPALYYPSDRERKDDLFVIFSGGKFELRKSQDMVLKAVKILQEKFDDIVLMNAWFNLWPQTMYAVSQSSHINFEIKGNTWEDIMNHLYNLNSIDPKKVFTLPLVPSGKLREIYLKSDVGLFPNRCEGGTNLVMMEYMACGKPVIGSYNSGHKDILTEKNSLPLLKMKDFQLSGDDGRLTADWKEPDIDEIVAKLEYAYFHRDEIKQIGARAAGDLKYYSWDRVAGRMLKIIRS